MYIVGNCSWTVSGRRRGSVHGNLKKCFFGLLLANVIYLDYLYLKKKREREFQFKKVSCVLGLHSYRFCFLFGARSFAVILVNPPQGIRIWGRFLFGAGGRRCIILLVKFSYTGFRGDIQIIVLSHSLRKCEQRLFELRLGFILGGSCRDCRCVA